MDGGIFGTLLGSLLGFLASVLPEVLSYYRDKFVPPAPPAAPAAPATPAAPSQTDDDSTSDVAPDDGVDPHLEAEFPVAYVILDFLRASVRPVVTYAFFAIFGYIKIVALWQAFAVDHTKVVDLLPILWDQGTEALFAAVIAFWFGSQIVLKLRRKK